jgi:hypothetical protein
VYMSMKTCHYFTGVGYWMLNLKVNSLTLTLKDYSNSTKKCK